MSWRHLSGLLGIALTVKMAGVKKMFVHGPPSVVELMKLTRHFADASTTEVVQSSILQKPMLDSDFVVAAFELTGEESIEPRAKAVRVEYPPKSQPVYAYLFRGLKLNRKLDPAKCVACGVPSNVMHSAKIRQLVEGHPLVLDDGRVISPEEVTSQPTTPRNILALECPHESYIPRFLQADQLFNAIAASQEGDESVRGTVPGITLAIHFVPPGLFESPAYQAFVSRLNQFGQREELSKSVANETKGDGTPHTGETDDGDGLHHLVLDGSEIRRSCPPVTGIFGQSITLHTHFDPHLYPKLMALHSLEPKLDLSHVKPFSQVVYAEPMMRYGLRPHTGFDTANCVILDEKELLQQAFDPLYVSEAEAEEAFKKMRSELNAAIAKRDKDGATSPLEKLEWPEFTFLGTASSSPSKYRNISAILMRLSPDECILLDCGEGTLNQLYALHGIEGTHRLLRGLRLILITHMHADHHGGVMTIARKVYDLTRNPAGLPVLAPPPFWKWVNSYTDLFQSITTTGKHVHLFPINRVYEAPPEQLSCQSPVMAPSTGCSSDLLSPPTVSPIWQLRPSNDAVTSDWRRLLEQLKLKIEPVRVPHTGTSWAYVLSRVKGEEEDARPWKVVFSGDTPPCSQLAEAGRDCDLLIHEATMGDGYEEQAVTAHHSTTGEAIAIGRLMRAKFILLTHFSQRYSRLPSFDTFQEDIAPAFDFMQVRLGELWKLPYFLPFYKYAFARHWELLQTRADANQQRRARVEGALEETRHTVSQALGNIGTLRRSTRLPAFQANAPGCLKCIAVLENYLGVHHPSVIATSVCGGQLMLSGWLQCCASCGTSLPATYYIAVISLTSWAWTAYRLVPAGLLETLPTEYGSAPHHPRCNGLNLDYLVLSPRAVVR
ncbi:Ribonuclease Z [Echinococcus granulosus]|uniref:ribonuclease Z n=1 Tax=Echinococcus granulosus TaxID=6210 RepID=W6UPF8_ECHGR|nr:Ribonuclease Z [Echinococcus granulosus]EUB63128.1 Ribonuclease Z [Echinococcus granulosus]